jgi:chorismate mutase
MGDDGEDLQTLTQIRGEIESVDRSIVLLLAARLEAAQRALRARAGRGHRLTDPAQERRVLQRSRRWAREVGVPEAIAEELFRTLIEEGKVRFRRSEAPGRSPVVTVLLADPHEEALDLGDRSREQLVAVAPLGELRGRPP